MSALSSLPADHINPIFFTDDHELGPSLALCVPIDEILAWYFNSTLSSQTEDILHRAVGKLGLLLPNTNHRTIGGYANMAGTPKGFLYYAVVSPLEEFNSDALTAQLHATLAEVEGSAELVGHVLDDPLS